MVGGLLDVIDEVIPTAALAPRAFEIASTMGHPVYDCCYIALAKQCGAQLATADARLLTRRPARPEQAC